MKLLSLPCGGVSAITTSEAGPKIEHTSEVAGLEVWPSHAEPFFVRWERYGPHHVIRALSENGPNSSRKLHITSYSFFLIPTQYSFLQP